MEKITRKILSFSRKQSWWGHFKVNTVHRQETERFQKCSTRPRNMKTRQASIQTEQSRPIEEDEELAKKAMVFHHRNRRATWKVKQGMSLIRLRLWDRKTVIFFSKDFELLKGRQNKTKESAITDQWIGSSRDIWIQSQPIWNVGEKENSNLAPERAEPEGLRQAPAANLAGVGHSLAGPRLPALVEEHNLGTVDDVSLHAGDVDVLLDVAHPHHVVIRRPPYLQHIPRPNQNPTPFPSKKVERLLQCKRERNQLYYLNDIVVPVIDETVGAERVPDTVEAEQVAFALVGVAVNQARHEVVSPQHRDKPRRTHLGASRVLDRTHLVKHQKEKSNQNPPRLHNHRDDEIRGDWESSTMSVSSRFLARSKPGTLLPDWFVWSSRNGWLMGLVCLDGNWEKRLMGTEGEL